MNFLRDENVTGLNDSSVPTEWMSWTEHVSNEQVIRTATARKGTYIQKVTVGIFETHNEQSKLGKSNTHKIYWREEKQEQTDRNLTSLHVWMIV